MFLILISTSNDLSVIFIFDIICYKYLSYLPAFLLIAQIDLAFPTLSDYSLLYLNPLLVVTIVM